MRMAWRELKKQGKFCKLFLNAFHVEMVTVISFLLLFCLKNSLLLMIRYFVLSQSTYKLLTYFCIATYAWRGLAARRGIHCIPTVPRCAHSDCNNKYVF
jgi:hypothetical protein